MKAVLLIFAVGLALVAAVMATQERPLPVPSARAQPASEDASADSGVERAADTHATRSRAPLAPARATSTRPNRNSVEPEAFSGAELTATQREQLEELKDKVLHSRSFNAHVPGGDFLDYIRLFAAEPRDPGWASAAEDDIARRLSHLPWTEAGLSQPLIRCATSICEVMIVQPNVIAQNAQANWQTQFVRLLSTEKPEWIAGSATLTTDVGDDQVGFVSYVVADRQPLPR